MSLRAGLFPGSRGQIAIPALFVFPFLVTILYLVVETANLSREKIRHQFGVDTAAFAEMMNYSDFLNRAAYINGAFPERVLYDAFYKVCVQRKKATTKPLPFSCGAAGDRLYSILWKNGAFPAWDYEAGLEPNIQQDMIDNDPPPKDPDWLWKLKFGGLGESRNQAEPHLDGTTLNLITAEDARDYWITWDDAQNAYKLYVEAYTLLGSVMDSQRAVFVNNAGKRLFYRKSYWMNTGAGYDEGWIGAGFFNGFGFAPKHRCVESILIYGNKPTGSWSQTFQVFKPGQPMALEALDCGSSNGLFQVETVDTGQLNSLREPTYVVQRWDTAEKRLSANFFNVDFHREVDCADTGEKGPCVRAAVALENPAQGDASDMGKRNGLWPVPVPKFQTRMWP